MSGLFGERRFSTRRVVVLAFVFGGTDAPAATLTETEDDPGKASDIVSSVCASRVVSGGGFWDGNHWLRCTGFRR